MTRRQRDLVQLDNSKAINTAQAAYNQLVADATKLQVDFDSKVNDVQAAVTAGQSTELDGENKISDLRKQEQEQLDGILDRMKAIPGAMDIPALVEGMTKFHDSIVGLNSEIDTLAKTMRDDLVNDATSAFTAFETGAETGRKAIAQFTKDIENQILSLVNKKRSSRPVKRRQRRWRHRIHPGPRGQGIRWPEQCRTQHRVCGLWRSEQRADRAAVREGCAAHCPGTRAWWEWSWRCGSVDAGDRHHHGAVNRQHDALDRDRHFAVDRRHHVGFGDYRGAHDWRGDRRTGDRRGDAGWRRQQRDRRRSGRERPSELVRRHRCWHRWCERGRLRAARTCSWTRRLRPIWRSSRQRRAVRFPSGARRLSAKRVPNSSSRTRG